MIRDLLKKFGKENDNCMLAILSYFNERRGVWINKAELTLQHFPYVEKGITKYFEPETIGRKARDLATYGLIERGDAQQAFYRWPEGQEVPKKNEIRIEMRDGRPVAVLV